MRWWEMLRAEQETIIRWDEEEKLVHVYSASPVVWRRLEKQGFEVLKETTHKGEPTGRFYTPIPIRDFRWGRKAPRSEAQLEAARKAGERFRKLKKVLAPDDPTGAVGSQA
jgi:hypothetical protein